MRADSLVEERGFEPSVPLGSRCGSRRSQPQGLEPNDARLIAAEAEPTRQGARDVFAYFDNDAKVRVPVDARSLRTRLV